MAEQQQFDKSSATPRTDAIAKWQEGVTVSDYNGMVDHARQLERELAEAQRLGLEAIQARLSDRIAATRSAELSPDLAQAVAAYRKTQAERAADKLGPLPTPEQERAHSRRYGARCGTLMRLKITIADLVLAGAASPAPSTVVPSGWDAAIKVCEALKFETPSAEACYENAGVAKCIQALYAARDAARSAPCEERRNSDAAVLDVRNEMAGRALRWEKQPGAHNGATIAEELRWWIDKLDVALRTPAPAAPNAVALPEHLRVDQSVIDMAEKLNGKPASEWTKAEKLTLLGFLQLHIGYQTVTGSAPSSTQEPK